MVMIDSNKKETIKITLIKSVIGTKKSHKATIIGLGLKRLNSSRILANTPEIRGMINKINYLIKCD
jgi:large subunit ribosomal protein L30